MSRSAALGLLMVTTAVLLMPAWGGDSHLGLKLEKVSCQEAVLALQRASGIPIELKPWEPTDIPGGVDPPLVSLEDPASFDWSGATFATAFRQLADRYRLRPETQRGGFALIQEGIQGSLPVFGAGSSTTASGLRLQVRWVGVSGSVRDGAAGDQLSLRLHGVATEANAAAVTSVTNVIARDNRGGILRSLENPRAGRVQHAYPDEWTAQLRFEGIQPGATRLDWLEGDVIEKPILPLCKLQVPLPIPEGGIRCPAGEGSVEFLEFTPPARKFAPGSRHMAGPQLLLRLHGLDMRRLAHSNGYEGGVGPVLVGASGRTYSPPGCRSERIGGEGGMVWNVTCTYPVIDEPVTGIRFEFGERQESRKRCSFRIRDVPLPDLYRGADTLYYGALFESDFDRNSPDFAVPGGILVSPIQVGEHAAPAGFLSVGLAPADGSRRTEWHQLEVTTEPAQLAGVRPGTYRVLRLYRPREHGAIELPRWWLNGETVVQVQAGKKAVLPPLDMPLEREPPVVDGRAEWPPRSDRMVARVDNLQTSYTRSQELSTPSRRTNRARLTLDLSGTGTGVESTHVARLGNVLGRDDRGNLFTAQSSTKLSASPRDDGFQWSQQVTLNAPHPDATRISWLEGDLMAHDKHFPLNSEFSIPVPAAGAVQVTNDVRCEVDSLTSQPVPAAPGLPASTEYLLRGRIRGPRTSRLEGVDGGELEALLIGRSGKVHKKEHSYDHRGSGVWEFRTRFVVSEPVVKIRLSLRVWPPLRPVGSFRLTNVPLKPIQNFLKAPDGANATAPGVPYYPGAVRVPSLNQKDGGRLVLPVRIGNQPARGGLISIGIARTSGPSAGSIRWTDAEVVDGAARIEDLEPGTYRVLRVYRVRETPQVKGPGAWNGADLEVTVNAGKETVARPLQWLPLKRSGSSK